MLLAAMAAILGVPLVMRGASARGVKGASSRVIIITPHVRQISEEFGAAFAAWHEREYGETVEVDWRGPLGTSEIIKLLQAQYAAAIRRGDIRADGTCEPGAIGFDIMFGGGSFDHRRLKDPKNASAEVVVGGERVRVSVPMSEPLGMDPVALKRWFEEPPEGLSGEPLAAWAAAPARVGVEDLYDGEQYWVATALSSFGLLYNGGVLEELGVPAPETWEGLTHAGLAGMVALADPRQSGSLATALEMILNAAAWREAVASGFDDEIAEPGWSGRAVGSHPGAMERAWWHGWRTLRELTANARYYANSSTKPPIDVSHGEAAAALAIDFYGKSQAAAVNRAGDERVRYVDPISQTSFDPDPISVLRGGPNPEIARRFVAFCLTEEAQAMWVFPPRERGGGSAGLGPSRHELHRMPVVKGMYEKYGPALMGSVNPFEVAPRAKPVGWRDGLMVMFPAFSVDVKREQGRAWRALNGMRARVRGGGAFDAERAREAEALFYSFPVTVMPDGAELEFTPENFSAIAGAWRDADFRRRCRLSYTAYFRGAYARVVELCR